MDRSTPIYLVAETYQEDEYGVLKPVTTNRLVYANVREATRAEWFEGGRNGLNPAYQFTMFGPDYQGEQIVQYRGQQYAVYRTYTARTDVIELHCERRKGKEGN